VGGLPVPGRCVGAGFEVGRLDCAIIINGMANIMNRSLDAISFMTPM